VARVADLEAKAAAFCQAAEDADAAAAAANARVVAAEVRAAEADQSRRDAEQMREQAMAEVAALKGHVSAVTTLAEYGLQSSPTSPSEATTFMYQPNLEAAARLQAAEGQAAKDAAARRATEAALVEAKAQKKILELTMAQTVQNLAAALTAEREVAQQQLKDAAASVQAEKAIADASADAFLSEKNALLKELWDMSAVTEADKAASAATTQLLQAEKETAQKKLFESATACGVVQAKMALLVSDLGTRAAKIEALETDLESRTTDLKAAAKQVAQLEIALQEADVKAVALKIDVENAKKEARALLLSAKEAEATTALKAADVLNEISALERSLQTERVEKKLVQTQLADAVAGQQASAMETIAKLERDLHATQSAFEKLVERGSVEATAAASDIAGSTINRLQKENDALRNSNAEVLAAKLAENSRVTDRVKGLEVDLEAERKSTKSLSAEAALELSRFQSEAAEAATAAAESYQARIQWLQENLVDAQAGFGNRRKALEDKLKAAKGESVRAIVSGTDLEAERVKWTAEVVMVTKEIAAAKQATNDAGILEKVNVSAEPADEVISHYPVTLQASLQVEKSKSDELFSYSSDKEEWSREDNEVNTRGEEVAGTVASLPTPLLPPPTVDDWREDNPTAADCDIIEEKRTAEEEVRRLTSQVLVLEQAKIALERRALKAEQAEEWATVAMEKSGVAMNELCQELEALRADRVATKDTEGTATSAPTVGLALPEAGVA
jgi:hypothetical protein